MRGASGESAALALSDFEIVKMIGKGSAGTAQLARCRADGSMVCLKMIEGSYSTESHTVALNQSSWAEVRVLQRLAHPHVIGYQGCFQHGSTLHVVMEFAEGGDLEKLWLQAQREQRGFSEQQVVGWTGQIAQALEYVHSQKVLHRDLKLANVLLDGQSRVKLADFGLARTLDTQSYLAQTMCGTPFYISPELCKGEAYGSKSDIWALGCILYELLTLRRPFDGNALHALVLKICTAEVAPLYPVRSRAMAKLVSTLLQKDPNRRPRAAELVRAPIFSSLSAPLPPVPEAARRLTPSEARRRASEGVRRLKNDTQGSWERVERTERALSAAERVRGQCAEQSLGQELLSPAQRIKQSQECDLVTTCSSERLEHVRDRPSEHSEQFGTAHWGGQRNSVLWSKQSSDALALVQGSESASLLGQLISCRLPQASTAIAGLSLRQVEMEKFVESSLSPLLARQSSQPQLVAALLVLQRVSSEPQVLQALRQTTESGRFDRRPHMHCCAYVNTAG